MRDFALGVLVAVFLFTGYGAVADEESDKKAVKQEAEFVAHLRGRITSSPSDFGALFAWRQWRAARLMHKSRKEVTGRVYDTGPGPGFMIRDWEHQLVFARTETAAKYCLAEIEKIDARLEKLRKRSDAGTVKQK